MITKAQLDALKLLAVRSVGIDAVEVLPALISTAHMSAAETLAHARFKAGNNVRVVSSADHSVIHYELNNATHRVDLNGQIVRPLVIDMLAVPEGAKATGVGKRIAVGVIDMTPKWVGVLPILIMGLQNGTDEGQKIAKEELLNMAKAADAWNAHCSTVK